MQLKKAIEDIVRSIPAEESQKNKYRLELYAHLHELYEEERPHHSHESAAFGAALNRLGQPESLRAEFLKSLSPLSRWMGRLDYALSWQRGESFLRHVVRVGGTSMALYFVAAYVFVIPLCALVTDKPADMRIAGAVFGITIGLNVPALLLMISVLQAQSRRVVGLDLSIPGKCLRMAGVSVLSILAIWGTMLGSLYILLALSVNFLGEAHAAVAMLEHERTGSAPLWCSVWTVVAVLLSMVFTLSSSINIRDWPYAE